MERIQRINTKKRRHTNLQVFLDNISKLKKDYSDYIDLVIKDEVEVIERLNKSVFEDYELDRNVIYPGIDADEMGRIEEEKRYVRLANILSINRLQNNIEKIKKFREKQTIYSLRDTKTLDKNFDKLDDEMVKDYSLYHDKITKIIDSGNLPAGIQEYVNDGDFLPKKNVFLSLMEDTFSKKEGTHPSMYAGTNMKEKISDAYANKIGHTLHHTFLNPNGSVGIVKNSIDVFADNFDNTHIKPMFPEETKEEEELHFYDPDYRYIEEQYD